MQWQVRRGPLIHHYLIYTPLDIITLPDQEQSNLLSMQECRLGRAIMYTLF